MGTKDVEAQPLNTNCNDFNQMRNSTKAINSNINKMKDENGMVHRLNRKGSDLLKKKEDRKDNHSNCFQNDDAKYAIKMVNTTIDPNFVHDAMIDLAIEARFLAILGHPNIIRLRAIRQG